jgi:3-oxoacyl-[acyl-carrier-protein] synthase II
MSERSETTRHSVAITGVGALGSWGAGEGPLVDRLEAGRPVLRDLPPITTLVENRRSPDRPSPLPLHPRVGRGALVDPGDLSHWVAAREARRMSQPSRFALAAARMAVDAAGLAPKATADAETAEDDPWTSAAVILATSFGPSSVTEEMLEQILLQGPEAASPAAFAESVANAPAAQLARAFGARGPNLTLTQREAGPLSAVARSAGEIAAGRSRLALAGGVDEVTAALVAIYDRARALARGKRTTEDDGDWSDPIARPFDRRRSGVILGEGATVVTLESTAALERRGGTARALVVASGSAFDPTGRRNGWGDAQSQVEGGNLLGWALADFFDRCAIDAGSIDLVVAGAAGSIPGDAVEARMLQTAWQGAPLPPVVAPKAVTGELGGGHLAAAVATVGRPVSWGTPWAVEPSSDFGVTVFRDGTLTPRRVLATAVSAGGAASWLVLQAPDTPGNPSL